MPTYDYVCEACGHSFEHFQSMSSPRLATCPKCKKKKLVRLVGAGAGLIFKGTGFYETDYKRQGSAPKESSGGEASSSSGGDSSATKEAPAKEPGSKATPAKEGGSKGSATPAKKGGTASSG